MRFVILFLVLFSGSNVLAQSRFSIGASTSYLSGNRIISKYKSGLYKDYRDSKEGYLQGFDFEAVIWYKINDKLNLETGVGFSKTGYSIKETRLIDPGFSPVTTGYYSELYRFTNQNLEIPFHLVYNTMKRLNYYFSIGPSVIFPVSEKVDWILRKEFGKSEGQTVDSKTNESDKQKINLSMDLGIGIGYRLWERFNIALQRGISYNLIGTENTYVRDKLYDISLFSNENKATKEHLISYGLSLKMIYSL
jgi:hypothetical protein